MKKSILVLTIALMTLNVKAHVNLNNPLGGETYNAGDTVIVEWQIAISHTLLNWDLFFSDNGGSTWNTIQIDIPSTGSAVGTVVTYEWIVPGISSCLAKIKIIMDNAGTDYQDISGNFTINQDVYVYIPDVIFKAQLVGDSSINTNSDCEIQLTEATAYTGAINVAGLGIADLTGIEAFTGIVNLDCSANSLTTLDVTQNTALEVLSCGNNQMDTLVVSNNTALTHLTCDSNQITILDVSSNPALLELVCENNLLTVLDISNNTALTHLHCDDNQLSNIDVSNNTALVMLSCRNNEIATLDVSMNNAMVMLECGSNQLTSLNVQNGNNVNFVLFSALNNPGLTCIEVDDDVWSTANWTQIDPVASFSTNCSVGIEVIKRPALRIHPNPANGSFTFEFEQYPIELRLFDSLGKLVFFKIINEKTFKINTDEFERGIYFYNTTTEDENSSGKLILQ
ncbi:MAG: T9SS type A sorting domain-containing protein [Bacteroidetes bacterium]|nr:T9SS type A sorting domain-containing protein [Bacteroidota bacterium]